jgi:hypothetical protein
VTNGDIEHYDELEVARRIIERECDLVRERLVLKIKKTIRKRCQHLKVVASRDCSYATRSGPKVISFPRVDIHTLEMRFVMPVVNLELKH